MGREWHVLLGKDKDWFWKLFAHTVGRYRGNSGGMVKADGENNMELLKILNKKDWLDLTCMF